VVVEKPIALRLEHVDEMMAEAERRQRLLWVAFQNRYNPAVQKAREAVVSGRLGKPVLATVRVRWCREQEYYEQDDWHGTWAMDGGVVSQQAIHHVDALRWTMGEVDSVEASCATRLANMECEDLCVASLRFKSGALGVIEATTAVRPRDIEASLSLIGENGTIVLGGLAMNNIDFWEFSEPIPEDEAVPMLFSQEVPTAYGFGHDILFQRVVATVMDGTRAEISGSEARKALEILHAIYASCESGERVLLKDQPTSSRLGISTTGS
jgi:predicted dehydrogenase